MLGGQVVDKWAHLCEHGLKQASLLPQAQDVFIYKEVFCHAVNHKSEWTGHGSKSNRLMNG